MLNSINKKEARVTYSSILRKNITRFACIKDNGYEAQTMYEERDPELKWLHTTQDCPGSIFSHELHHSQRRELRNVFLGGSVYHVSGNRIKFKYANSIVDRFDNYDDNDIIISDISNSEIKEIIRASVLYFDDSERVKYKVKIKEGVLFSNGKVIPQGCYIFALNEALSELCLGKKKFYSSGNIQHSSFYAGQAVSSSGYISIEEHDSCNAALKIEMSSGHYRPSKKEAYVILKFLQCHGVNLENVSLVKPYNKDSLKNKIYSACVDLSKKDRCLSRISRIAINGIKHKRSMTGLEYVEYFERKSRAFCNLVITQLARAYKRSVD